MNHLSTRTTTALKRAAAQWAAEREHFMGLVAPTQRDLNDNLFGAARLWARKSDAWRERAHLLAEDIRSLREDGTYAGWHPEEV